MTFSTHSNISAFGIGANIQVDVTIKVTINLSSQYNGLKDLAFVCNLGNGFSFHLRSVVCNRAMLLG